MRGRLGDIVVLRVQTMELRIVCTSGWEGRAIMKESWGSAIRRRWRVRGLLICKVLSSFCLKGFS